MRLRLTIVSLVLLSALPLSAQASTFEYKCISDSGLSRYELIFNPRSGAGTIRYQFMEQDILYAGQFQVTEQYVSGTATFVIGYTGETRGTPINFVLDRSNRVFLDNAASVTRASCQ